MFDSYSTPQHRRTIVLHPLAGTAVHMFHLQNEHTFDGLDVLLSMAICMYHVRSVWPRTFCRPAFSDDHAEVEERALLQRLVEELFLDPV